MKTNGIKSVGITFLILLGVAEGAFSQSKDTIYWTRSNKLKWEDFKGQPDNGTNLLAMTQAGIGYQIACNNGKLYLKVHCYFNVNKSWVKETDSEELLAHEQLHFDITELYTRKLRKKLSELADPCGKNIKELDKLYQNSFNDCAKAQDLYDKESEHSINSAKQKEWEEHIAEELKLLEKFSSELH